MTHWMVRVRLLVVRARVMPYGAGRENCCGYNHFSDRCLVGVVWSDWQKTDAQKRRERLLLDELVTVVNKRDELVQHLDSQERAIEDDELLEKKIQSGELSLKDGDKSCVVQ
ncbi:hypothetical protein RRG08_012664 [Elysia crispata]|uniref:BMERB domain-containing protein n=1 Tax=Elysia crispata TaxID=231223 RepID=A0AAE1D289_9GAST|nr:hypothetical protein RRG08_012664 [Elysia crispata]